MAILRAILLTFFNTKHRKFNLNLKINFNHLKLRHIFRGKLMIPFTYFTHFHGDFYLKNVTIHLC